MIENKVKKNEQLRKHTTFHIGGSAEYFVSVKSEEELQEAYGWAKEKKMEATILAGGSNVLISDSGIKGLVIKIDVRGVKEKSVNDQVKVTVSAGEVLDECIAYTVEKGWWGLENLSGIPGSVGATPIQNVGAYGVEVKDVITQIHVYDIERDTFGTLSKKDCHFAYRDSVFKHAYKGKKVITSVTFELSKKGHPNLEYKDLMEQFQSKLPTQNEVREAVLSIRKGKFPDWHVVGTAGSFFKNPIVENEIFENLSMKYKGLPGYKVSNTHTKISLGWLLDNGLSLKGYRVNNIGTYGKQALVIVNYGDATADEVIAFATEIQKRIYDETGLHIEWEVTKIS